MTVNRDITDDFIERMQTGVRILDANKNRYVVTRPCTVNKINHRKFSIILTQGYNRQIRRMCEYFDYRVVKLLRTRVMNIQMAAMKPGDIRYASEEEIKTIRRLCEKRG